MPLDTSHKHQHMQPERCNTSLRVQCFGPLAFLDVPGSEESASGQSLQNSSEAEMALYLFSGLLERYPELRRQPGRIGIMSPYKGQVPVFDWGCYICHHDLHWVALLGIGGSMSATPNVCVT